MEIKTYLTKTTPQFNNQLQEILRYIAVDLQNSDAALQLLDSIEYTIKSLENFPYRFSTIEEEPWGTKGLRKVHVKSYFLYYWVNEDLSTIQIVAIMYSGRDQKKSLSDISNT